MRKSTPDEVLPNGGKRITVQRCCNGCGRPIGDVTDEEMEAAILGLPLPDVRNECFCLANQAGDTEKPVTTP